MATYDWSRFVLRVPVKAGISEVYQQWATPDGLEYWFLRQADFTDSHGKSRSKKDSVEAGDRYTWRWHGWSDNVVENGEILAANGRDQLKFSFGKAGNVTVRIFKEKEHTIVELVQYDIPLDEESQVNYHLGCTKGWLFYLTNLKSLLEGGIDLRNRDVTITEVLNS